MVWSSRDWSSVSQGWISDDLWLYFLLNVVLRQVVLKDLFIAEGHAMEIMMIHFSCITIGLSGDLNILDSTCQWVNIILFCSIESPNTIDKGFEIVVSFNFSVGNCMPFFEIIEGDLGLAIK